MLLARLRHGIELLVDTSGRVLYDQPASTAGGVGGSVSCSGACLDEWQPVSLPASDLTPVGPAAVSGDLGVVDLPGGGRQVTYLGTPLYRWVGRGRPPAGQGWAPVTVKGVTP